MWSGTRIVVIAVFKTGRVVAGKALRTRTEERVVMHSRSRGLRSPRVRTTDQWRAVPVIDGQLQEDKPQIDPDRPYRTQRDEWLREFEVRYLECLIAKHGGNITAAARSAELDRAYLYRLLWRNQMR
uniref:hypothetical protein n=1 Tax=Sandaracinus sp. TaxID=2024858 RepID=UPI0019D47B2F|nr:hypothetical protein [Sandaracinus sp.]